MLKRLRKAFTTEKPEPGKLVDVEEDFPSFTPTKPGLAHSGADPFLTEFWQGPIKAWLEQLPEEIRPHQLLAGYPRVVAKMATLWDDRTAMETYLFDLLVDKRGNRRGFPAAMTAEIRRLQVFVSNGAKHYQSGTISSW